MKCPGWCGEEIDDGALRCPECEEILVTAEEAKAALRSLDRPSILTAVLNGADSLREAVLGVWTTVHKEDEYDAIVEFLGISHGEALEMVLPEADTSWQSVEDVPWDAGYEVRGGVGALEVGDVTFYFATGDWEMDPGYEFNILSVARPFGAEQRELLTALDRSRLVEVAVAGTHTSLQDVISTVACEYLDSTGVPEEEARTRVDRLWETGAFDEICDTCFPDAELAVAVYLTPDFPEGSEGFSHDTPSYQTPYYVDPGGSSDVDVAVWEIQSGDRGCCFTWDLPGPDDPRSARGVFTIHFRWGSPEERDEARLAATRAAVFASAGAASSFDDMRQATASGYHFSFRGDERIARAVVDELGWTIQPDSPGE